MKVCNSQEDTWKFQKINLQIFASKQKSKIQSLDHPRSAIVSEHFFCGQKWHWIEGEKIRKSTSLTAYVSRCWTKPQSFDTNTEAGSARTATYLKPSANPAFSDIYNSPEIAMRVPATFLQNKKKWKLEKDNKK